ncbi:Serine protease, subtilisin family [Natrinema hispanicum]|uniref:Serine protease, subtilisin family n=2 Tax=Natrinema hispanicum TaxID=392421 RepID=A0A1I0JXI2_9EURY|nr:Serine protease, subtilisin family [Natrinema hispanicum]SEU15466.1 Serine protease, subtilisin family [Natrinema hispanicum]
MFVDELFKQSAKTAITLLMFVGLPDASIDSFRTGSNFIRLCNTTERVAIYHLIDYKTFINIRYSQNNMMPVNRRSVIRKIGAIGTTLTFAGVATASSDRIRYIVRTNGNVNKEIQDLDYEVLSELAGGNILLIAGPEETTNALTEINGVSNVLHDFNVELEEPPLEQNADSSTERSVDQVYEQFLWDKQLQQVREAHAYATGSGRTVAVLDTGVDNTHPDLDVDIERSAVIIDGQPEPYDGPRGGDHATHVAGTVAGTGAAGMLGTAPDTTIVSVRILGPETGTWGDILAAMEYAAEIGADAANMSVGTYPIPPQRNAVQYRRLMESVANNVTRQGTLLVAAAGNNNTNLQQGGRFTLPNSLAGVISVSASTPSDHLSFYSNYGTNEIDIGAPGGGYETPEKTLTTDPEEVALPYPRNLIYSTLPVSDDGEARYGWKIGTSMAAPQVAGLVALVREIAPNANAKQVQNVIQQSAEGDSGYGDPEFGAGQTNALAAVEEMSDNGGT